ncbi:hypothetical protein CO174_04710 [Candidatus Uhrbacteria bacterium CG_4_9_14_3_um_filter_50_9]|uniref:EF-hand domain-containing protein n=1 Tax=Candidatus Uhrbacteria bacterium CG_4_9_14_3_um_filter_50_9 TaxID=1975035 RepID=A0A2M7XB66_9BACT|nr:MAG: hypothetical protein CO174_04710 [Candidatus Uhrbacteria bacterium CG_4_9_14_3_um_filter_50_9]
MAIKRIGNRPRSPLGAEQKIAFALLMFLGVGGVFFGFKSFGANLMRPIQTQIADLYTGETFLTTGEREAEALEESKTKDTDGDGLVDYDELYIYKTSPYIIDSDSDGYSDYEEVYSGNDPGCPVGRTCSSVDGDAEEATTTNPALEELIEAEADSELAGVDIDLSDPESITEYLQTVTMNEVRAALLESGVSQEELDAIDDETLAKLFYETLSEIEDEGAAATEESTETTE